MSEQVRLKDISLGWFNEEFGQALRDARGTRTQASVAKAVNRQSGHISRVELGKTPISFEEAVLLTKELPLAFTVRDGVCSVELQAAVAEEAPASENGGYHFVATENILTGEMTPFVNVLDPVEVAARYTETGRLPEDEGCSCADACSVTGTSKCWTYDADLFDLASPPVGDPEKIFAVSKPDSDNRSAWKRLKDWWVGTEFIAEPQPRISAPPSDLASS